MKNYSPMKKLFITIIIVFVSILSIQAQEKVKIAVMEFTAGYGVEKEMVNGLSDVLVKYLSETNKFVIVEREQLNMIPTPSTTEPVENTEKLTKLTATLNYSKFHDEYSLDIRITTVGSRNIIYITKVIKDKNEIINEALCDLMPKLAEELTSRLVEDPDEHVYDFVYKMPSFPGGEIALMKYLNMNIRYPATAVESAIQGRVICRFIVKKDGSIFNVEAVNSIDSSLDREAVRVIEGMPKWNPGTQDGEPVNVRYILPITFRIQ